MKIHYLQHVPFETPANIEKWAKTNGHPLSATQFYRGDPLPEIGSIDWLVVMGGPMNIDEEDKYPWLLQEKKFIEQAIKAEKVVIGICLGAQLIAAVLGAKVFQNQYKEIGWFPIQFTEEARASSLFNFLPQKLKVFHWHGDTFDLPPDATRLAQSEACANQAFIYNKKVLALQFHLEVRPENVRQIIAHCEHELTGGQYIQKSEEMLSQEENFKKINEAMDGILNRLPG
ncbi:glutamine amidotransferase class-I [Nitrosococcus halophilus Nc 4]|uniref:Glutamine amidotransferase class-I n=1 Tax=Nitrosococcus halophilus (strain Nc4) TaxID=472759 RepID=D5C218_NITHN|nr:type 1 glutamine amidotransferase [Nitrosococcus halophilus]ADE16606.1 glutamine amidotransferase class-I [Nitrosococcus halophilus Nc 4]